MIKDSQLFVSRVAHVRLAWALVFVTSALMAPPAMAVIVSSSGAGTTSNYDHVWNDTATSMPIVGLPTSGTTAIINQDRLIQVDTAIPTAAGSILVNNTNDTDFIATLEINPGGSLTAEAVIVSAGNDPGFLTIQGGDLTATLPTGATGNGLVDVRDEGTLDITSGSLTLAGANLRTSGTGAATINLIDGAIATDTSVQLFEGELNISGGTFTNSLVTPGARTITNGDGILNITGGTLTATGAAPTDVVRLSNGEINISGGTVDLSGGQVHLGTSALTITGDAADITMDRLNLGSAGLAATINFDFGPTGISTIKGNSWLSLAEAIINIDGTNYTGGAGTFDLLTTVNLASESTNVSVTGFGTDGIDYNLEQDADANIFRLVVLGGATGINCDFVGNGNGCDVADLDDLYSQLGGADLTYDMNNDLLVDASDIPAWLVKASDTMNLAKADMNHIYMLGDVDLNGQVDSTDLGLLLNNFSDTNSLGWGGGNLNGDSNVDSIDLGQLLNNFNFVSSASSVSAVPEPNFVGMLVPCFLAMACLRRRRR